MQTTIKLYNQSVSITTRDGKLTGQLEVFLDKFYTINQRGFGQNSDQVTARIFASIIPDYQTVVLHRNQFTHFIHFLQTSGESLQNYVTEDHRDYNPVIEDYKIKKGWALKDEQLGVNAFLKENPTKSKLVPLATGSGKAQPLTSLVRQPGGWIKIGDVKVGTIVTARDGSAVKVTGVYPQGIKPVYKLTFSDGRSCKASDEHLWKVYLNGEKVLTTLDIKKALEVDGLKVYIDTCEPEKVPDKELPVDPYILGKRSAGNISNAYLNSSYKQKIKLLEGIFSRSKNYDASTLKTCTYETADKETAKKLQQLVWSIGGYAKLTTDGIFHKLMVTFDTSMVDRRHVMLEVTMVEYVGDEECQCISINHPEKLYITDNFIVTHNTVIALYTIGELKSRLGIIVLSQFIEKWVGDIVNIHDCATTDVMVVQGSKALAGVITMAKEGRLVSNYYLFSARTMQDYISMYEQTPELCVEMYGAAPLEVFPLLGIGILLIDETHMAFHAIYKTIIHMNVKYQIGLSGTLISEDTVVSRAHRVVYPKSVTYHDNMQKQYMDIYAIAYGINPSLVQNKRIKTVNYGSTFYSHIAFEQSIMKDKRLMDQYYRIIKGTMDDYYIPDYDKRDSIIIYVATIKMADTVLARLKEDYPDKNIVRYCENDDYDTMIKAEVVVTTPQSLSTGIDKPELRVVIQTVSISSEVTNVQSAGRLRYLKDRDVKFCYIYSDNISKQREYHKKRQEMFRNRAKSFSLRRSRYSIS